MTPESAARELARHAATLIETSRRTGTWHRAAAAAAAHQPRASGVVECAAGPAGAATGVPGTARRAVVLDTDVPRRSKPIRRCDRGLPVHRSEYPTAPGHGMAALEPCRWRELFPWRGRSASRSSPAEAHAGGVAMANAHELARPAISGCVPIEFALADGWHVVLRRGHLSSSQNAAVRRSTPVRRRATTAPASMPGLQLRRADRRRPSRRERLAWLK